MARIIPRPAIVLLYGTSLTSGRLSGLWDKDLQAVLRGRCNRQVIVMSMGKGSQTSDWGVSLMDENVTRYRPDIIVAESFAINDSAPSLFGSTDARSRHQANVTTMISNWQTQLPDARTALATMSSVSVGVAAGRPELDSMYQDDRVLAAALGVDLIDSRAGYPSNLPDFGWTYSDDGLHPLPWVVSQYHLGNVADYCAPIINAMAA